jgi:diguanylate cyclase (GGDEF)-like protein
MHHHGPFASWPSNLIIPRNVALQIYLGFNMVSVLPASVLFAERRWIELELRDALERLSILALVDGLTGVANRRALDERLVLEWNRARREGSSLAVLMVDLDMFKQFNDLYGHQAGDNCLCRVAEALTAAAHRCTDFAGRFGGEEFVLLLPQLTIDQACHFAEGIRQLIAALSIEHRSSPFGRVTVSIGCAALCPGHDTSCEDLLEMADRALYRAKQEGRDRVCNALLDATATA